MIELGTIGFQEVRPHFWGLFNVRLLGGKQLARRVKEGDLYAVALGEGVEALCRVLYKSARYRNVVLMGCYGLAHPDKSLDEEANSSFISLTYTGAHKEALEFWRLVSTRPLSDEEKAMSLRIVAGSVWLGDEHIGTASPQELAALPEMNVYGERLFIKKIRQECQA